MDETVCYCHNHTPGDLGGEYDLTWSIYYYGTNRCWIKGR